jgi:uncharacterized protein (TIGR03437 family)
MNEMTRRRLAQAVRREARSRYRFFGVLALLLCFICVVTGISFLYVGNSPVRAAEALAKLGPSEDHLWRESKGSSKGKTEGMPEVYRALILDGLSQRATLLKAPMEFTKAAKQTQVVMTLPMPDGSSVRFRVEESPVVPPLLAARFPEIKTYRGHGLDDSTATTRFDVTPAGFHAVVLSGQGTVIIEPDRRGKSDKYISYYQRDADKEGGSTSCVVVGAESSSRAPGKQLARSSNLNTSNGTTLRYYRLALAATAEFTQVFGGGTVAGALSAITTNINAVNAIYERDLGIHLTLVANETSIIFTNTATDGYTSDNVNTMLSQNQTVLDQRIGSANYDVGMVFDGHVYANEPGHFIFQGAANYQSVCKPGQKGTAVTVLRSTEPSTVTAIYVVAHELGHQFGALHTFNGTLDDCGPSRFAQTAYEPGSGSTIMGYRGGLLPNGTYYPLCSTEELFSNDTYFHTASIEQINNYTSFSNGSFCPSIVNTDNNPPNVDAGADYTIPANTPFTLTATGSDADADALTYCWEEYDLGAAGPPHTDNGDRPIFRSFAPVATPQRTFPQLSDILSGTATFGEALPTTSRTMNFRVTLRDNHPGGVNAGGMHVNTVAGPAFVVTQPNSATTWTAGSNQTVTWDVANTSNLPVNCGNVRVLLSIDGGLSFPFTLAASTPNNGTAAISVPNLPTSTTRVKVEAVGNIFFSISLPNFTIAPNSTAPPTLLTEENSNRAIALDAVMFVRDPFALTTTYNLGLDPRTRIMLFATGLNLMAGEDTSVVTAQAEDSAHKIYPLVIEYVGKVRGFDWLTQVNIKLPDGLATGGDVLVSVSLRGAASNKVLIGTRAP